MLKQFITYGLRGLVKQEPRSLVAVCLPCPTQPFVPTDAVQRLHRLFITAYRLFHTDFVVLYVLNKEIYVPSSGVVVNTATNCKVKHLFSAATTGV
jgi:hypothetical protein